MGLDRQDLAVHAERADSVRDAVGKCALQRLGVCQSQSRQFVELPRTWQKCQRSHRRGFESDRFKMKFAAEPEPDHNAS
jgi:hypothetical protein